MTTDRQSASTKDVLDASDRAKMRALPWALGSGVLIGFFSLWTFGGSLFVLFLNALDLPKGQIGWILSLFPFCGLLAMGFAPVAARIGRKRVFLVCYGLRKPVMALLLVLPWMVARYGHDAGIAFLSGVILVFAVLRALAETAFSPWTQEFVPNRVRGRFSAWSAVAGLAASSVALAVAARVLATSSGLHGYLLLIAAGTVLGLIGVIMMRPVPGGAPIPSQEIGARHWSEMAAALRDRQFTAYLGGMAGITIGSGMLTAFLPLYLRERLGLGAATVVSLDIATMGGGALASLALGWFSDRLGSRPVLMPTASLLALVPLGWLLLPPDSPHRLEWCTVLYLVNGVAANGVAIGAGRLLFNRVVPLEQSTAYTSIHYAWMGLTGGIAPLLAGGLLAQTAGARLTLGRLTHDGYAVLFGVALVCLVIGTLLYGRVRPDDRHTTRTALRSLFRRITQRRVS